MNKYIYLILIFFIFVNSAKADDISDFEIEGMSIGDSLLTFFDKNKISKSIVDWYDDLEKNKYVSLAFNSNNFNQYDFVDVWTKYGDKKFMIIAIAGVDYFGKKKEINDIEHCYVKQLKIADDISRLFSNSKIDGPHTIVHESDPSGKSIHYIDQYNLDYPNHIRVECTQFSHDMINSGLAQNSLNVVVMTKEINDWITSGYN